MDVPSKTTAQNSFKSAGMGVQVPDGYYCRELEEQDLPQVLEMVNWIIANTLSIWRSSPDTLEGRKEWLKTTKTRYPAIGLFDSSNPDMLVGFASAGPFRYGDGYDKTTECSIACRQELTGRGLGHYLIQELLGRLIQSGYHVVVAGISSTNQGSCRFFAREGFTRTALMPKVGEKNGILVDLELWQLDLRTTIDA